MLNPAIVRTRDRLTEWWLANSMFDPACIFCFTATFIDSYAIRGALSRIRSFGSAAALTPLDLSTSETVSEDALLRNRDSEWTPAQRLQAGVVAFCDRVVAHQGVQGPPEALFMGYGLKVRNGLPECSCVADQASSANALLDAIETFPSHPRAATWLECIRRWADWVLREFSRPNGAVGVGIFGCRWNPIPEYWCATGIATAAMFKLARLTDERRYLDQGLRALDWLARFDHVHAEVPRFEDCPPEIILYTSEGIMEGLEHLANSQGIKAARSHPVAAKQRVLADWLVQNQLPSGRWPEPASRGYRCYSAGLPWELLRLERLLGPELAWRRCAENMLNFMSTPEGEAYMALYNEGFTTGLAFLSFSQAASSA